MPYDPTLYLGTASHYALGRPAYSRELASKLAAEVGLDGSGRLLDVGCGPGVLALELAHCFEEVIGLDPDAEMLLVGARAAEQRAVSNIRWVRAVAERIAAHELGKFKLVTFGQSFHWTDRERVAEIVYDCLEPGGVVALIDHAPYSRPRPDGPRYPPIPHDVIHAIIDRYLGSLRRAGKGFRSLPTDPHEGVLARARFGAPHKVFCAGREDIVQDIDGVLANYFSTSFAAPHLFEDQRANFEADLRAALRGLSPSGLFWDWPGDTEIVLAAKTRF